MPNARTLISLFTLGFFIFSLSFMACRSKKKHLAPLARTVCKNLGTVVDYNSLDGCKWLLRLDDGTWLLPVETDVPQYEYADLTRIRFSYDTLNDIANTCIKGRPIRVRCIEPVPYACTDTKSTAELPWLMPAIERLGAKTASRFYEDDHVFYTITNYAVTILYDCKGQKICEVQGKLLNECAKRIKNGRDLEVIWKSMN